MPSTVIYVAERTVEMIGFLFPVWIGLAVSFILKRVRKADRLPRGPVVFGMVLVAIASIGIAMRPSDEAVSQSETAAKEDSAFRYSAVGRDTQVIVSSQEADGITEANLTPVVATRLGNYTLERVRFHTQKILDNMRSKQSADSITAESVVVKFDGKPLVVTRFRLGEKVPFMQFFGIMGKEAPRVLCMAKPTEDVILAGNCFDKVKEVFGVSVAGIGSN
jgi:hypothetical protein